MTRLVNASARWVSATALFVAAGVGVGTLWIGGGWDAQEKWNLHQIVLGTRGNQEFDNADGLHMVDVNGDGCPDAAVPYEEGRNATISLHPCDGTLKHVPRWSTLELPTISPNLCNGEDAHAADVDLDGHVDLVVGCEGVSAGTNLSIFFQPDSLLDFFTPSAWARVNITAAGGTRRHMRVHVIDLIPASASLEILVGQKEGSTCGGGTGAAGVGYWSSATPRVESSWSYTQIVAAGWVMNMTVHDIGFDGDTDIVYASKEHIACPAADTTRTGLRWLENTDGTGLAWTEHQISPVQTDWRWHDVEDWDGDGDLDIVACRSTPGPNYTINDTTIYLADDASWSSFSISISVPRPSNFRGCHHVVIADWNLDGVNDLAMSSFGGGAAPLPSTSVGGFVSLIVLYNTGSEAAPSWQRHQVGRIDAIKQDNLVKIDMEGDGDIDLATTEQQSPTGEGPGIGVYWAENPVR